MAVIEKRKAKDGTTKFRVKIRIKGQRPVSATFTRQTDAKKWAKHTETQIETGQYFKAAESKKRTLAELIDRYIDEIIPTKKSKSAQQTQQLDWWKAEIGHLLVADVTPAVINEKKAKFAKTKNKCDRFPAAATINRYLAVLRHAFTIAVMEWEWAEDTPFRRVRKEREPRGRMRLLNDEERKKLLEECAISESPFLLPIVILALSTGMRRGEILNLRWNHIDFKRELLTINNSKNGDRRSLPLTHVALRALNQHRKVQRIDTDLVFPSDVPNTTTPIDFHKAWYRALRDAEVDDFRFHDLRHCAASYLAMSGATVPEIAAVLGHRTLAMVQRYTHLTEQHTVTVVKRMNEKFL